MHGHWESTTRKLNKHYQSARKSGGILPPDDYIYGDFYIAGGLISSRYIHDTYSPGSEYYNRPARSETIVSPNLVNCFHIRGLHKKSASAYKAFFTDPNPFNPTVSQEAYDSYMAEVSAHRVGQCISNGASLYQETGERYFRYSLPTEAEATPYNVGVVEEGLYSLVKWKRETVPVMIDFSLASIQAGEFWFPSISGDSYNYEQLDSNGITIYTGSDSITTKIYTTQAQGKGYAEGSQGILVKADNDPQGTLILKNTKIYCFLKNRNLYIDMRVHIFDPDTGVDETELYNVWLNGLTYPYPLYATCTAGGYRQPTNEYYPTYPSPAQGWYDYDTYILDTLHYGAQYWHYYVNDRGMMTYQPMATNDYTLSFMAHPISEGEFLAAKGGLT